MSQREIRTEIPTRAQWNRARPISRGKQDSEIKRVETANEKRRKGESESAGVSVDERRWRGWSVKSKQSDAQREIERGERVSLFFINRPIKQERPPLDVLFHLVPPFPSARSFRISFPSLALSSLFCSVLFSRCRESLCSCLRFSLGSSHFISQRESPLPSRREEALPLSGPQRREKSSLFAILFNFFARGRDSFYYLGARLQCLADNKPMKATFEPEGPLKSPFSPTSRFFFFFVSLTYSRFLSSSSSHMFSRSHSFCLYRCSDPLSPFFLA